MKRRLRFTEKEAFDAALTNALSGIGITILPAFDQGIPEKTDLVHHFTTTEEIEGEQVDVNRRLVLSYYKCAPKARDVEGNFIVTATDEEGNPTAYEMAPGYHVELACNLDLEFPAENIVNPTKPQFSWA